MEMPKPKTLMQANVALEALRASNGYSADRFVAVLDEDNFHDMLLIEKKRAQRSGKPSMLLLLSLKGISDPMERASISSDLVGLFNDLTRETDLRGWYESGSVFGVIFTELGQTTVERAKRSILKKLERNLGNRLGRERAKRIKTSIQTLPGTNQNQATVKKAIKIESSFEDTTSCDSRSGLSRVFGDVLRKRGFWALCDLLLIVLAHVSSTWIRFGSPANVLTLHNGAFYFIAAAYLITLYTFDLYNLSRAFRSIQTVFRVLISAVIVTSLTSALFYFVPEWQYGRGLLIIQSVLISLALILWRMVYGTSLQAISHRTPALIVGAGEPGKEIYKLFCSPMSPYEVKGFLDDDATLQGAKVGSPAVVGFTDEIIKVARRLRAKAAILAIPRTRPPFFTRLVLEARLQGMDVLEVPTVYEQMTGRIPVQYIEDQWLLFSEGFQCLSREYLQKIKRIMDFITSALLLIAFSPLIILTCAAIKLNSKGSIFYKQDRVGKGGKVFTLVKFRSMCSDAEKQGAVWAKKKDPRVTWVGRWIRLFRIDELPQIWNVLKGDMSLVGPRPERPEFVKDLDEKIPYYNIRHTVLPGITGWAQINYSYGSSLEDAQIKLEYDLYYIKNLSLMLDLKILLRTVGVVLLGEGAR